MSMLDLGILIISNKAFAYESGYKFHSFFSILLMCLDVAQVLWVTTCTNVVWLLQYFPFSDANRRGIMPITSEYLHWHARRERTSFLYQQSVLHCSNNMEMKRKKYKSRVFHARGKSVKAACVILPEQSAVAPAARGRSFRPTKE